MEGLEISEINLLDVVNDNDVFRLDPEYFGKAALLAIHRLSSISAVRLGDVANITDGIHESLPFVEHGPVKVLSAKHPKDNFITCTDFETISQAYNDRNPRTALCEGDVLLTTVGTIGNAAVVTPDILPANSDRHIGIIRLKNDAPSPYFVSTCLVSRYGRLQSVRETTGNVQPNLFISKIGQLLLPRFSSTFEATIASITQRGYVVRKQAEETFEQAEQTLLHALGLKNWQPPEPLTYTRRASDAFTAGRLDSDYFAPRVLQLLQKLGEAGLTIGSVAPARHERFTSGRSGDFDYIEIGNIRADGTVEAERLPQSEAPSRATQYVRAGDVLTSSVRPIRRLSALATPEQDGFVCSSGFVVLQPREVPAEMLLTYLRLPPVCELMDLHTSASLYPAISEADLLALPFHPISKEAETAIVQSVRSAHVSRRKAHSLLEAAKRAVEIAIEQSEAEALAYLGS